MTQADYGPPTAATHTLFVPGAWYQACGVGPEHPESGRDCYAASPQENPAGPLTGSYCVIRGGGWFDNLQGVGSAMRYRLYPSYTLNTAGFRAVQTAG